MSTNRFDMEHFRITPEREKKWRAARAAQLLAMTPEQRRAHDEAEEADAWREALSDEVWGKA